MFEVLLMASCFLALGALIAYDARKWKSPDGDVIEPYFDENWNIKGFRRKYENTTRS